MLMKIPYVYEKERILLLHALIIFVCHNKYCKLGRLQIEHFLETWKLKAPAVFGEIFRFEMMPLPTLDL